MKVQQSIEIAAAPAKVWPFFIEPVKVLQWYSTFQKFEYTGDQRSGAGTRLAIDEQAGGKLSKMQFEVTEWKENEKLAIRMVSGANYTTYIQEWILETIPTGTRFTFMEEVGLPGIMGRLIGPIAGRMSAAIVKKMLTRLKALVEIDPIANPRSP